MGRPVIGEVVLLEHGGKVQRRWTVRRSGEDDTTQLLALLDLAETLCDKELRAGGSLKLYNTDGNLVKEIR